MADAIIERETEQLTQEARVHQSKISENYKRLLDSASPVAVPERAEKVAEPAPTYAMPEARPAVQPESVPTVNNAARFADYTAHRAPAGKKVLFEDVTYQGQELVMSAPAVAPAFQPAFAQPAQAPAVEPATEEDALPTRRTMETLNRSAVEQEQGVSFFSALSTRMKMVLVTVAVAIVVFLALIIVNASILSALDAQISGKEAEQSRLEQVQKGLNDDIANLKDPDTIGKWAQQNGMTKGN